MRGFIQLNITLSVFPFLNSHSFSFFFGRFVSAARLTLFATPFLTTAHYYSNKISIFLQWLFNKTKLFIDYFICENSQRRNSLFLWINPMWWYLWMLNQMQILVERLSETKWKEKMNTLTTERRISNWPHNSVQYQRTHDAYWIVWSAEEKEEERLKITVCHFAVSNIQEINAVWSTLCSQLKVQQKKQNSNTM